MNPVSPFELHADALVGNYLAAQNPYPEVRVKALFQSKLTKVSDSKIDIQLEGAKPVGIGYVFLNPIALVQDSTTTFNLVIPHELAHVFTKIQAFMEGSELQEHGEEWSQFLLNMNCSEAALPTIVSEDYNYTANKLLKGYVPWSCPCGRSFVAVFNTTKALENYINGSQQCSFCQNTFSRVRRDSYPSSIARELQYLESLDEKRNW